MTPDQAVKRARAIQADLESGRLSVPYPVPVQNELRACVEIFAGEAKTVAQARALVARINGPATAELPW